MKALLIFLILAFLLTGCQAEINEVKSPEVVDPSEEKADFLFDLLGKSQEEILELFDEVPQISPKEEEAGIKIEDASTFFYPEENIYLFFSEDGEVIEVFLSKGVFLGFEIKETLNEEEVYELFGEPDETVRFRDRDCLVYYMENRGDVLFVKETEDTPVHISIFPSPQE